MDLRRRWWRSAFERPHVFVLPWPGATSVRLATEAFLRENGWPISLSTADTDILLVAAPAGTDVPAQLSELADRVWGGVPAPRARLTVTDPLRVEHDLFEARTRLIDPTGQLQTKAEAGATGSPVHDKPQAAGGMEHGDMHHDGMGHGDMEHGGMETPAGLPLAGDGPDRDGLNLDVLHVALGPALPYWPAGLRLMLTIQGDVVVEADVERPEPAAVNSLWSSTDRSGPDGAARTGARKLDSLTRLFAVAGADRFALTSARIRDRLLAGAEPQSVAPDAARLRRRAAHSALLVSMTRRIPLDPDGTLHSLPAPGDVARRWTRWLEDVATALAGGEVAAEPDAQTLLSALPRLVVGRELAEVRLIVAALDPDLDELAHPTRPDTRSAPAHA